MPTEVTSKVSVVFSFHHLLVLFLLWLWHSGVERQLCTRVDIHGIWTSLNSPQRIDTLAVQCGRNGAHTHSYCGRKTLPLYGEFPGVRETWCCVRRVVRCRSASVASHNGLERYLTLLSGEEHYYCKRDYLKCVTGKIWRVLMKSDQTLKMYNTG